MRKVALVTGGSGGIGRAVCLRLAQDGFDVAVHYNRNADSAQSVCREIELLGGRAVALCADLTESSACSGLIEACVSQLDGLDVLVNNAGVTDDALLLRMSDEQYHRVISANLDSCFYCTRAAVSHMAHTKTGRIINITSVIRPERQRGTGQLCRVESGYHRIDQVLCKRDRSLGRLRQRGRARLHRNRHD